MAEDNSFSNDWQAYAVQASLNEDAGRSREAAPWPEITQEEIVRHQQNIIPNAEAKIFLLPLPIVSEKTTEIFTIKTNKGFIRLYPPFQVNEKSEASAAFSEIGIPAGNNKVTGTQSLSQSTVTGLTAEQDFKDASWCRGFRIDSENRINCQTILDNLLEQIAQYTFQWWLRAIHNPFLGPQRFAGQIDRDYNFVNELRYRGAGEIKASWYGVCQYQSILGIGSPMTSTIWKQCCNLVASKQRTEVGIMSFLDGIAAFMAGRINQSILHLCIAVEILANKHRMVVEGKSDIKLDKLIKQTPLLNHETRKIIKNLMVDRGHVAHGREPHCLGKKPNSSMQNYIKCTGHMVNAYLAALRESGKWNDALNLKLG